MSLPKLENTNFDDRKYLILSLINYFDNASLLENYRIAYFHNDSDLECHGIKKLDEIPQIIEKTKRLDKPYLLVSAKYDPEVLFIHIGKKYGQTIPFTIAETDENSLVEWKTQACENQTTKQIFTHKELILDSVMDESKQIQISFTNDPNEIVKPVNSNISIICVLSAIKNITPQDYTKAKLEINDFLREICTSKYSGRNFIVTSNLKNPLNYCIGTLWKPNIFGPLVFAHIKLSSSYLCFFPFISEIERSVELINL